MRIGLIARADDTGLGNQTKEFYDHIKPAKTMVIDMVAHNNMKFYADRYPDGIITEGFPSNDDIDNFLKDLDLVFTCETPYNYHLFSRAKELGIKTVLQYNYEFLDYLQNPTLPPPDLLAAPSPWNLDKVVGAKYLPVPVNREKVKHRKIREAKTFVHIAGRPAYQDRNGTAIVLSALRYVENVCKLIIYCQQPEKLNIEGLETGNVILEIRGMNVENYADLYREGDVLVLPRKYGGLCLPFNEASSAGMPSIMTNCAPQSHFIPDVALVKPQAVSNIFTRTNIEVFEVSPVDLAARIDYLYENPGIVQFLSEMANRYADKISWANMKDTYMTEFEALCNPAMK